MGNQILLFEDILLLRGWGVGGGGECKILLFQDILQLRGGVVVVWGGGGSFYMKTFCS